MPHGGLHRGGRRHRHGGYRYHRNIYYGGGAAPWYWGYSGYPVHRTTVVRLDQADDKAQKQRSMLLWVILILVVVFGVGALLSKQ